MPDDDVAARIRGRLANHGLTLQPAELAAAAAYIGLLTKWNATVNLTSVVLRPLTDEAIDRLLTEPFIAASWIAPGPGFLLDVGSGSGSPAIPLKIARPDLELVMVESKARKSAFLREAIRELALQGADVVTARFQQLVSEARFQRAASTISIRAVRADRDLWQALPALLHPGGRVLWFRSANSAPEGDNRDTSAIFDELLELETVKPLVTAQSSELAILRPRTTPV